MVATVEQLKSWLSICLSACREAEQTTDQAELTADEFGNRSEQWYQSHIMIRLNDAIRRDYGNSDSGIYVISEPRVSWLDDHCGSALQHEPFVEARGELSFLRPSQRFDLSVWDRKWVIGLIEVKNAPSQDAKRKAIDAGRIELALQRWGDPVGGKLRWGMVIMSERLTRKEADKAGLSGLARGKQLNDKARRWGKILRDECSTRKVQFAFEPDFQDAPYEWPHLSVWCGALIRK